MKLKVKLKDFLFSSHGVIFNLDLEPCLNKCSLDGSIFWLEAKSGYQFWNQNILAQSCWRTIIFISVSIQNPPEKVSGKKTPLSGTDWTLSPTWLFFALRKKSNLRDIPWIAILEAKGTQLLPEILFQSQIYVLLSWSEGHGEILSLSSLTRKQSNREMRIFVFELF